MRVRMDWAKHLQPVPEPILRPRPRFITDRRGVLRDANLDACLMVDLGQGYLVGKRLGVLVERADLPQLEHLLQSIGALRRRAISVRIRSRTGALHPVEIEASLTANSDEVIWTARLVPRDADRSSHAAWL
jgi:hypothetical protein